MQHEHYPRPEECHCGECTPTQERRPSSAFTIPLPSSRRYFFLYETTCDACQETILLTPGARRLLMDAKEVYCSDDCSSTAAAVAAK